MLFAKGTALVADCLESHLTEEQFSHLTEVSVDFSKMLYR